MMDRYLAHYFRLGIKVLKVGSSHSLEMPGSGGEFGWLHLVRSGTVEVHSNGQALRIERPSLLLIPRLQQHQLIPDRNHGADVVGATLAYDGGTNNMAVAALPDIVCCALDEINNIRPLLALLFEATPDEPGWREMLVERLLEVVMLQILHHLVRSGQVQCGLFSGFSHPRLCNALKAMHDEPGKDWTLNMLANVAGMSRSAFSTSFRATVGTTPGSFLQSRRIQLAQKALGRGRPLKIIADEIGYGSESALSRAFKAQTGKSPRQWKAESRRQ